MTVIGLTDPSESAQLAGGYGLMLMGSAVYLLGGLGLRQALAAAPLARVGCDRARRP